MTRTDIYNASSRIFSELPDEDTFALDMTDSQKAAEAFQSMMDNKDKYDEMGVMLPSSVEEFQAIITGDIKKKSTSQEQGGKGGSTQTQQSNGSKTSQAGKTWQLPGTISRGAGLNQLEEEDKALNVLSKKPTLKFVEDKDLKAEIRSNPKAWTEKVIEKNPSLRDQTIDGVLPGLMDDEPTIESESKQNLEKAKKLVDYTESYDQDFDNMVKESDSFAGVDIKNDPKKYKDAVLNDYLQYLKVKNGEDSQAYLDVKERVDYYKSLGDKLYNDETYADDLKRFQDLQKESLNKISNNSYAKSIAIQNNYDWDYFSKKASDLDTRARLIEKQMNELGIQDGKVLSAPQRQKYDELTSQYNQIQSEFSKLSQETNIDDSVIDQMRNVQQQMNNVKSSIESIDNEEGVNAESIRKYKAEQAANKKAQEEFYNTKADGNVEAFGKGVAMLGQQAAKTFVEGIFDIARMPEIAGEAFGAKGYGWSDKLSETADNINSMVELYNPQLETGDFSNFMKFMNTSGQGLGSVAQFITAGSGASRLAKGLRLSEKGLNTANKTAQFVAAASTSTAQLYNDLIDAGFKPEDAARYSLGGGVVMGAAEMLVPDDELIKNEIKQTFISALKSGSTTKEAIQNGLSHIGLRSAQISSNVGKETFEEGVGSLAESFSKEVASTMTGNKIDGIWNLDNFNADAIAGGGGTAFIIEMMKFGPRKGRNSNPFEENLVGYLAENYDKMVDVLSKTHPEDYDKIADRFKKLKDIHDGLKNTPAFNKLSKSDQDHILAQAHAKQVILENIKQSGLDKAAFADQISSIDEDIFQTLNGLRSKDTWVDTSKNKENAIQEPSTEEVLPRQQGATTETGSEPQGMGQGVQGEEATQEGQEVSQEGLTPEQKQIESEEYISKLEKIRDEDPLTFWSVSVPEIKDVKEGTIIKNEDGQAVVSKDGDIKALYKNPESEAKNVADSLLKEAIKKGGVKLDNFDIYLTPIYKRNGFRIVSRVPFNKQYAPTGWDEAEHGTPDVVAMVYDPENKLDIEEKRFEDYNEAMTYRDSFIDAQKEIYGDKNFVEKNNENIYPTKENNINFDDYELQNNRLSQEEERGRFEGGPINVESSIILDSIQRSIKQSKKKPKDLKKEEESALLEFAKENNLYVENPSSVYGEELSRGAESSIYMSPDNSHVIKITSNELHHENWMDFFDRISLHNTYFPETKYEVLGFSKNKANEFSVILKQPLIQAVREATSSEIKQDLEKRGFQSKGMNRYHNPNLGIFIGDLHSGNVVVSESGNLFYIDPVIKIDSKEFTISKPTRRIQEREDSFNVSPKEYNNNQKSIADIIRGLKSKGGKLYSAGLGIPVAIWDGAVEIVASAVEAGESISKALNKAKKYLKDNLKDKYNEDVFNKLKEETEKQSGEKSNVLNIDIESVRKKDRPGKRISKGLAKKAENKKEIFLETDDISIDYVKKNAPVQFIKNAKIIAEYPLVKAVLKGKKINTVEDAQKVYDVFVRQVADNLKYLMDQFDPEFKDIATLWYDGANAIANDLANEYGITPEQVAGILASLSPQKDWYQNVRLAELVLMAYKDNPVLSQEMLDYQKTIIEKGLYKGAKSPGKQLQKAENNYKKSKTKLNKQALDEARQKLENAIKDSDDLMSMLEEYLGKKMDEVPEYIQPYMVRTYHEVNTTKDYDIITPDGNKAGVAKKAKGENAKVAWGSYGEIGKAVSIYNNGSPDNITRTLGEMHKIRNFNNNIIDPMSEDGDVTIDTHAVAAALLIPLSGNSKEVKQNFGTGTGNSPALGIKGLYFAYADAYALAAKESGLLPRQIQSITWEAVRGLYTASFKGNKKNVEDIKQIWKKYEDGEITIDEARELAKERAGGVNKPTWATGSLIDEPGESDQEEIDDAGVDGDGSDTIGSEREQPVGDLLTEAVDMLSDAEEAGGSEITKAQKEVSEKLGEEGKKIAEIDRNFDKLADDLGFIKTCII
jgi:hypothetical protein